MQTTPTPNNSTIFEHNNIMYMTEFSDLFDISSSLSLSSSDDGESDDDVPAPITSTPTTSPPRSPLRVRDLISPTSPGRNIDMMVVKKTKKCNLDNRRTLLQRFKSISRRRKVETTNDEEPLPATLPLESSAPKKATTPWEAYSKQNYFRGVFSG